MEGVDRKKCLLPAVKSVRRLSTHACGYRYFGVRRRGHPAVCGRACIYVMRHRFGEPDVALPPTCLWVPPFRELCSFSNGGPVT
mgnify:CR=1 FL=1